MFRRKRGADDFADEIKAHLELEADELKREGLSEDEAQRQARVTFGHVQGTQERFYLRGRMAWWDEIRRDLRFALRQLMRNRIFAVTAIVVLALGIGASTVIFSFADAALIEPLPYPAPSRLVSVFETVASCPLCNVSYQNFRDWQRLAHSFRALEVWGYARYALAAQGGTESAQGARISDGFFRTLGVSPMLGRDFYAGEDKTGAPRTVLLSYAAWQKRFGGDAAIVGHTVTLDDVRYAIIGVLPKEFHFAPRGEAEFWVALNDPPGCDQRRACHGLFGVARLQDGVTVAAASAEMRSIAGLLARQYPDSNHGYGAVAVPLSDAVIGEIRPVLRAVLCGAGLLLLIAYVNVMGLLLVRTESRRQEMAVREALGASTGRLMRQFVTEAMLLAVTGAGVGLGLASGMTRMMLRWIPPQRVEAMPFLLGLGVHAHGVLFAAGAAVVVAVLLTVAPALRLRSALTRQNLAEGARGAAGRGWSRLGSKLVVVELATSVILLVGAGLLGKSLYLLMHVEMGFQADHLASAVVMVPKSYKTDAQVMALERALLDRARSLPGAASVGLTVSKPIRAWDLGTKIVALESPEPEKQFDVPERDVNASYLPMLGARLVRGRYFTEAEDDPAKPRVVVINAMLSRQLFPGQDPVGKRIAYALSKDVMRIVGVVEDIKEGQLDTPNRGVIYVPFNQNSWNSFELVVRSTQAPEMILPTLLRAIHEVDKSIATSETATMGQVIQDSHAAYLHRVAAWLVGGFAALALVLSVVGLYGVVAYSVVQRTREIGVRMALGAQPRMIYALVMRQAGLLTGVGLIIGLACSLGVSMLIRDLLFGVKILDAMTLTCVPVLLVLPALAASFWPARRAAGVNPVEALRAE